MPKIQTVRGTHDLLGNKLLLTKYIRKIISKLAGIYDFNEIETPIFESSELFIKPLGQNSDVVLKEMYSFEDRNKSSLTLRPEFTLPMIRAAISNNLLNNLPAKLFSFGSVFRHERPQKGRYRQFNQINFEILGSEEVTSDGELIILAYEFLKKLKIENKVKLYLNSLGDLDTISKYNESLKEYFSKYKSDLSESSQEKINSNPLRILDSKEHIDFQINQNAPQIKEYYSDLANKKFDQIQLLLNDFGIKFEVSKSLVRGLDYYCHTVFEFKSDELGSQDTLIGGGRYDGLVKSVGGFDVPGVGWASGIERLVMMLDDVEKNKPLAQVITIDNESRNYGLDLLFKLRKLGLIVRYDHKNNIKKSLKNANDEKIKFAIIIGEEELNNKNYTLKNLIDGSQKSISYEELINSLQT